MHVESSGLCIDINAHVLYLTKQSKCTKYQNVYKNIKTKYCNKD